MRSVSILRKIHDLLTPSERRRAVLLLALLAAGMLAEALGIGLVIPAVALMLRPDIAERYPESGSVEFDAERE